MSQKSIEMAVSRFEKTLSVVNSLRNQLKRSKIDSKNTEGRLKDHFLNICSLSLTSLDKIGKILARLYTITSFQNDKFFINRLI